MATAMGLLLMKKSGNKAISGSRSQLEEEEEVERTVFLRANGQVNKQTASDWYVIKLSSKNCTKTTTQKKRMRTGTGTKTKMKTGRLVPCKTIRRRRGRGGSKNQSLDIKLILRNVISENSWNSCFVAVGSTIYCTSAANAISRDVLAWDTTNPNPSLQWQPVASMNLERRGLSSKAVTAGDGKIYVFGGYEHFKSPPIDERFMCEVFDPSKNEWESINPPPPEIRCNDIIFSVYDYSSRRIILGSKRSLLFYYDLRDASWGVLPQTFIRSLIFQGGSRPVFFDNTLYWIRIVEYDIFKCGVCAYNLDLQVLIHGPIMGIHPYFWGCNRNAMQLLHFRGDEFYLIWLDRHHLLRCERMRVSKRVGVEKQESSLECYILSSKTYIIDSQAISINAVVL